jgi:hypothetical protein
LTVETLIIPESIGTSRYVMCDHTVAGPAVPAEESECYVHVRHQPAVIDASSGGEGGTAGAAKVKGHRAWQRKWTRAASQKITEIPGVGAVESWVELIDASEPLVTLNPASRTTSP